MSLIKRLFGGADPDALRSQADAEFGARQYGQAKLTYERAARAVQREQPELARELQARAGACRDAIARARMAEAERLWAAGSEALAISEWEAAIETASDAELIDQVQRRLAELSADEPEAAAVTSQAEIDADTRFDLLTANLDVARLREYELLGPRMRDALLALHEERAAEAREALEVLSKDARHPLYLHYELGRARLLTEDPQGACEALRAFIAALGPGEGGEPRLLAHLELANAARTVDDFEGAVGQYEAAIEATPDDPRAYVAMAGLFRADGLPDEAVDVLESATAVIGSLHPLVVYELGRAHADAGRSDAARKMFERGAGLSPPDDPLQTLIAEALAAL